MGAPYEMLASLILSFSSDLKIVVNFVFIRCDSVFIHDSLQMILKLTASNNMISVHS